MVPPGDSAASPAAPDGRAARTLAQLLDGLVRTARSGPGIARPTAERLAAAWREHPGLRLSPTPRGLVSGDTVALPAAECGPWVLPVFVCGLRSLRPAPPPDGRPDPAAEDLLRLAVALGGPTPQGHGLAALQAWLWGDGAEGVEVGLSSGITDALDAVEALREEEEAAALRADEAGALDGRLVSSQDLDRAALTEEFSAELAAPLRQAARARAALPLTDDLAARMRRAVEDPAAWGRLEARVVVRHPDLRPVLPAPRLASRLADVLAARADRRSLGLLAALAGQEDAWSTELMGALSDAGVGEAIARGLVLTDASAARTLAELAPRLPGSVVGAAAVGLARRAAEETGDPDRDPDRDPHSDAGERLLAGLLGVVDVDEVLAAAHAADLSPAAAVVLARALGRAGAPESALLELLGGLPAATLGPTLATLPADAAERLARPVLTRMLSERRSVGTALTLLADRPAGDWRLVARILDRTGGEDWEAADLAAACAGLRARGGGAQALIGWVRDGKRPERLRLAALDAVAEDPRLRAEATARRAGELFDPPAVKAKLKALRTQK